MKSKKWVANKAAVKGYRIEVLQRSGGPGVYWTHAERLTDIYDTAAEAEEQAAKYRAKGYQIRVALITKPDIFWLQKQRKRRIGK